MKTRKIMISAMCLALSLILPQAFHLIGMQQAGAIFLPMHIPIFIGGMLLGPVYGTGIGVLAPIISCLLTGMPTTQRVLFMVVELASYGMLSGVLFHVFKLKEKKWGALLTQIIAMIFGRIMYAMMLVLITI
ncbi:MAG: ECF transporter S component, partial [Coprobacillaceae bacterium]